MQKYGRLFGDVKMKVKLLSYIRIKQIERRWSQFVTTSLNWSQFATSYLLFFITISL
jgi:hypothetical protein